MKVKSKIIAILLCAVLAFCVIAVFTACEETVEPPAPEYKVYSVTLQYNGKNIDGNVLNADVSAGTLQLTTKVVKDDGAEATVTYASSVSEVATVSKDGLVTLAGKGETVISATAGDKKHEIVLVVADDYSVADSYTITVNGGTASVTGATEGTYVTLTANVPEHQDFIEWEFSDNVTWVNGNVFKMPAGDVNVTAKFEAMKYTLNVVGATVAKADENTDPIGSDGGNTEGGELPEYDMNVYRFEYGTEISVEAIAEPEGKIFVGWDYGVENNRVGEMGVPEYGPFEMPDSTLTVWAVFSDLNPKLLTASDVGNYYDPNNGSLTIENGVPKGGTEDPDLEGLSGYRLCFSGGEAKNDNYPENITGSVLNSTVMGTQIVKVILKNHSKYPISLELYASFHGNLATSGEMTVEADSTLTTFFTAGMGIFNPWMGVRLTKNIGGESSERLNVDMVAGVADYYPNGDKQLQVSGSAEYVVLKDEHPDSSGENRFISGNGWTDNKPATRNPDIGSYSMAIWSNNFKAYDTEAFPYKAATIENLPAYDPDSPNLDIYIKTINNVNTLEEPVLKLRYAIARSTSPDQNDLVDYVDVVLTKTAETSVVKLTIPRVSADETFCFVVYYTDSVRDGAHGVCFTFQLTYNNVMGYVEGGE